MKLMIFSLFHYYTPNDPEPEMYTRWLHETRKKPSVPSLTQAVLKMNFDR